jgi:hypothetical protein
LAKAEPSPISARMRALVRGPIPGMDASSSPEGVGQERLLALGGRGVAAGAHPVQFGGQFGDDPAGGGLAGPPAPAVSQGA